MHPLQKANSKISNLKQWQRNVQTEVLDWIIWFKNEMIIIWGFLPEIRITNNI